MSATSDEDSQGGVKPPSCTCLFFQQWQLPCRHIWQHHRLFGVLTPEALEAFTFAWDEGGYEIYEGITTEWVEKGVRDAIRAPVRRRLDIRELLNGLMAKYYSLEAEVKAMAPHDADRVMRWWIGRLAGATGGIGDVGLAQFVKEVGWEKEEGNETSWERTLQSLAQHAEPDSDSEEYS